MGALGKTCVPHFKAFHVPIAFHKVHYIGHGEAGSAGRSGGHARGKRKKWRCFFVSFLGRKNIVF